ncbi:MAG TPA: alpha/beta hydrolase [Candidatus Omnitrophota bacterium]|nr:alpha/beta hydrolase [Candidatus Omnitrophota bacterium]
MISDRSEFKLLDRGFENTLVLIPGWATNHRLFSKINGAYNYLFTLSIRLDTFLDDLAGYLKSNKIQQVTVLGHSLGGFIAKDFCLKFPEVVEELFLVSIRKQYSQAEIRSVSELIQKNRTAFLIKFYKDCFVRDNDGFDWFKENLLEVYLEKFDEDSLMKGLEYLSKTSMNEEELAKTGKTTIFNSRLDKIAPFSEALELGSVGNTVRFVPLETSGHIPFLDHEFNEKFNG